jgi:hypothetical protein
LAGPDAGHNLDSLSAAQNIGGAAGVAGGGNMSPFGRGSCNARGCGVGAKTSKGLSGVAGGLAVGGRASGGVGVMEIGVSAAAA